MDKRKCFSCGNEINKPYYTIEFRPYCLSCYQKKWKESDAGGVIEEESNDEVTEKVVAAS